MPKPMSQCECVVIDLAERRRARKASEAAAIPDAGKSDFWAAAAAVGWLLAFLFGLALFDGRVRAAERADPRSGEDAVRPALVD